MERTVKGVFIAIVVIVALYVGFGRTNEESVEARQALSERCVQLAAYARWDEYIEGLIDAHHKLAFNRNYIVGEKASEDSFDEASYMVDALERMAAQADIDGMDKIAEQLRGLRSELLGISED